MQTGDKNRIESLLSGYLGGTLDSLEKQEFFDLLAGNGNEILFKEILFRNICSFNANPQIAGREVDFDGIYGKILHEIEQNEIVETERKEFKRHSLFRHFLYISATAAAIFAVAFFIGRISGSHIDMNTKTASGYTEIKAPFGSKSEIKLPDGTVVILNAGSVLTYSNNFNTYNRDVSLTGEAYFKVAKNLKIPLIVDAGSISIKAVGTEFNVKAYADEEIIETTLVSGKVEIVQEGTGHEGNDAVGLAPNQKAIFIKDEKSFVLEEIRNTEPVKIEPVKTVLSKILIAPQANIDQVVAWTEGKLILRGERLDDLCIELERKYDVKFLFNDEEIKKFKFTGVLLDETLEQVLNVIGLTAPIRYSLDSKTVYLSSDPHQLTDYSKYLK